MAEGEPPVGNGMEYLAGIEAGGKGTKGMAFGNNGTKSLMVNFYGFLVVHQSWIPFT
jgi:hypothetical protein